MTVKDSSSTAIGLVPTAPAFAAKRFTHRSWEIRATRVPASAAAIGRPTSTWTPGRQRARSRFPPPEYDRRSRPRRRRRFARRTRLPPTRSLRLLQRREGVERWTRPPRRLAVREVDRDEPVRIGERQRLERDPVEMAKHVVVAPMPRANVTTTIRTKPGCAASCRKATRKSCGRVLMLTATEQPTCRMFGQLARGSRRHLSPDARSWERSVHVRTVVMFRTSGLGTWSWRSRTREMSDTTEERADEDSRSVQLQVSRATNPTSSSFWR